MKELFNTYFYFFFSYVYQTENYTNPIKHEVPLPTEAGLFCENDKTRTMKRIAIQGIKGSYHDMAAHYFFHNEDIELICCSTFEEVFATVKDDSTILGMAAIENTIAGSLLHNYELLCISCAFPTACSASPTTIWRTSPRYIPIR